ncbi:hypothetical protein DL96DRAFT_1784746 [Flagelloscypha sp. PMI_526]|nr:hypothetical protein DL96DRAFT_1784746 [Flagelloscypha sp. PMI_526]
MSVSQHFHFALFESSKSLSTRKIHIRRLYDVLLLCLQRRDLVRAQRAWAILARCPEVNWMTMWRIGLFVLTAFNDDHAPAPEHIRYLKTMMLELPSEKEPIFLELIVNLIGSGQYQAAYEELELYLPSIPYKDNVTLHLYAGLLVLHSSQPDSSSLTNTLDPIRVRVAQGHFERARALDPKNDMATIFLHKIPSLLQTPRPVSPASGDEDSLAGNEDDTPRIKRLKS